MAADYIWLFTIALWKFTVTSEGIWVELNGILSIKKQYHGITELTGEWSWWSIMLLYVEFSSLDQVIWV